MSQTSYSTCASTFIPGNGTTNSLRISFIWLYNGLQIFGFIAVAGLTITAFFSSHIKRAPIWYMFMLGWVWWCISYFALVGQQTGAHCPAFGYCLVQAAMIYAGPPANACATLAILLELYLSIRATFAQATRNCRWKHRVYGVIHPEQVQRSETGMHCNIADVIPSSISAILVAIFSIVMLCFEFKTFIILYKNWLVNRQSRTPKQNVLPTGMIVRVSLFSFLPILALVLSILAATSTRSSETEQVISAIVTASLSGAAALIFGTQRDLLRAMFCMI
ncbi:hypothetical protein F5880DRAFT_244377 [Lentinula raphanica]|nr:hypothetical protein F5880DRAFT_244377 [Lentinula raphanica]